MPVTAPPSTCVPNLTFATDLQKSDGSASDRQKLTRCSPCCICPPLHHVEVMVRVSHPLLQPIQRHSQPSNAIWWMFFFPQHLLESPGGVIQTSRSCTGVCKKRKLWRRRERPSTMASPLPHCPDQPDGEREWSWCVELLFCSFTFSRERSDAQPRLGFTPFLSSTHANMSGVKRREFAKSIQLYRASFPTIVITDQFHYSWATTLCVIAQQDKKLWG